ncbi:Cell division protein FtsH, partial [hydrothermal vent metagenome]
MSSQPPKYSPKNDKQPSSPQRGNQDGDEPRRNSIPWLLIIVGMGAILLFAWSFSDKDKKGTKVGYSFFRKQVKEGNVKNALFVNPQRITGKWRKIPANPLGEDAPELTEEFHTDMPPVKDEGIYDLLEKYNSDYQSKSMVEGMGGKVLMFLLGPILIIGFFWFIMKRSGDPMGGGMFGGFARSPAKRFQPSDQITTFDDVAAMIQAKLELQELVEFLKSPEKFQRLGAQIPKGVLLMGSPGTGKTLLARATAGEAGVPFFSINGSEFIQMFVGVGASRVRDLFKTARESSPCIIFIDEIDAVGRVRGAGVGGGHDEREQTLNQILSEMDGFEQDQAIIVIAATNRPDVLDPALLRPGRFDRHIQIDKPTKEGRLGILKVHSRNVPLAEDVNLEQIAEGAFGFSGAELKNLVNEAALNASRGENNVVTRSDFNIAQDRVMLGPKREELVGERKKKLIAYHEAGHALVAWKIEDSNAVHKVTIIPRGRTGGVTQFTFDEEDHYMGEKYLRSVLMTSLGGRAAEKLVLDEYSAGAEGDLKHATSIARQMVSHWGMSEVIGPVAFSQGEDHPFLGKEMHEHRQFSEETAHVIDQEVQSLLLKSASDAIEVLKKHRDD